MIYFNVSGTAKKSLPQKKNPLIGYKNGETPTSLVYSIIKNAKYFWVRVN